MEKKQRKKKKKQKVYQVECFAFDGKYTEMNSSVFYEKDGAYVWFMQWVEDIRDKLEELLYEETDVISKLEYTEELDRSQSRCACDLILSDNRMWCVKLTETYIQ